jgi:hypothetical protein
MLMFKLFTIFRFAGLAVVAMLSLALSGNARAQFSKPVVILKGTVRSEETSKPTSVKVSVRIVGDTAREITSSTSNKETGRYIVVLKPGKSYWVHLEGDSVLTKDVMVTTPDADRPTQLEQDFTVALREVAQPELRKETN